MNDAGGSSSEFSHPIQISKVGPAETSLAIEASASERKALARRFGLVSLDVLTADCRLRPLAGGMLELDCRFHAELAQACVVSLAPVPATLDEQFTMRYAADAATLVADDEDALIDLEADDPPEVPEGGVVDLGEAVAQHLAVALDPYPRAPGIEFSSKMLEKMDNPFSILAKAKPKT